MKHTYIYRRKKIHLQDLDIWYFLHGSIHLVKSWMMWMQLHQPPLWKTTHCGWGQDLKWVFFKPRMFFISTSQHLDTSLLLKTEIEAATLTFLFHTKTFLLAKPALSGAPTEDVINPGHQNHLAETFIFTHSLISGEVGKLISHKIFLNFFSFSKA